MGGRKCALRHPWLLATLLAAHGSSWAAHGSSPQAAQAEVQQLCTTHALASTAGSHVRP